MPRLFHRPPKYGLHKSTKQAIVCHLGKVIFLGPHGSEKSHRRYQEFLEEWNVWRHQQVNSQKKHAAQAERVESAINAKYLRTKQRQGLTVIYRRLLPIWPVSNYSPAQGQVKCAPSAPVISLLKETYGSTRLIRIRPNITKRAALFQSALGLRRLFNGISIEQAKPTAFRPRNRCLPIVNGRGRIAVLRPRVATDQAQIGRSNRRSNHRRNISCPAIATPYAVPA